MLFATRSVRGLIPLPTIPNSHLKAKTRMMVGRITMIPPRSVVLKKFFVRFSMGRMMRDPCCLIQ
jgi:hypothetical protein